MPANPAHAFDLIVIGAGSAGLAAARRSAQLGARTLLIDRAIGATHASPILAALAEAGCRIRATQEVRAFFPQADPATDKDWVTEYLDAIISVKLVDGIGDHGTRVEADRHELWRRAALSIACNNTDDHARNHGFLRHGAGWTLSPAFDINPDPRVDAPLATSIRGATDSAGGRAALLDACDAFWLDRSEAEQQWDAVVDAVAGWREVAARGC